AAPARQLPWFGLHARLGHRGAPRARRAGPRRGTRGAAVHMASARRRLQAGRGSAPAQAQFQVKLRGLYAITPDEPLVLDKVRAALEGGVALLQYRPKR